MNENLHIMNIKQLFSFFPGTSFTDKQPLKEQRFSHMGVNVPKFWAENVFNFFFSFFRRLVF